MAIELYTLEQAEDEISELRGLVDRMGEVLGASGVIITIQGTLAAVDPVNGGPETLHSLSGFATGFSVGGSVQYEMLPFGNYVSFVARNIAYNGTGTSTDGATILTVANGLPAAYRPSTAKRLAATANLLRQPSAGVFESCAVEIEPDGSLQIYGLANGATRIDCHGIYSLLGS